MEQSPRLSLSYLFPQQAQKHVTVNESFRRLDAVTQISAFSRGLAEQVDAPKEGDCYIMPQTPTGEAWSGFTHNCLAVFQDGAWSEITPKSGWLAFIIDEAALVAFTQSDVDGDSADSSGKGEWSEVSSLAGDANDAGAFEEASFFGINTQADEANRFAVKSDAILFSHDDITPGSGDVRHVINKNTPSHNASLMFQTDFSGRIELGLLGNDDFTFQVSANGDDFQQALRISHVDGEVAMGALKIEQEHNNAVIKFQTQDNNPFWALGQSVDDSFYIQRLSGGFGTGGRVLTYNRDGNLGLWGDASVKGKISTRSNVNLDGVENILYLEQTALSPVAGIVQFHNNRDNATPILRCTTNTRTVLKVPASGSIEIDAPMKLMLTSDNTLPSASQSGIGAMVYLDQGNNSSSGLVYSDGNVWRHVRNDSPV